MEIDSIVVYRSFVRAIRKIENREERLQAYEAMFDYGFDHLEEELDGCVGIALELIKPQLDANFQRKMNGKQGGRPSEKPMVIEEENRRLSKQKTDGYVNKKPNVNVNVNVNDNVNANENVNVNVKSKRFNAPSLEDVRAYCDERKNSVDPERFIDFYTSKGWKVGSQPMKDWKAAVRTWERRETKDELPVYSTANNPVMNTDQEEELLSLMGRKHEA